MSIEINSSSAVCRKCGMAYGRLKGYFAVSYGDLYKGIGYLPYCKTCVDKMYNTYYDETGDVEKSVRQLCRKLDIYWNQKVFELVEKKSTNRTIMTSYLAKITSARFAGKSYDDTLRESGQIWVFNNDKTSDTNNDDTPEITQADNVPEIDDVPDEVKNFWGAGYTSDMYTALEQRKEYWMSEFPHGYVFDIGEKALIRQICALELDINRDRAAGRSADKNINTLNNLLGSARLKPVQQKTEDSLSGLESTPFGVWIYKWENHRPIPEIDDDLKDVNGLKKYIFTWFGHVCKMLGVKNTYTKLYEAEMERLRVEKPEFNEDDEDLIIESYSETEN